MSRISVHIKKIARKILLPKCLFIRISQTDDFININMFLFTGSFLNFEFVNMLFNCLFET